MQQAPVISGFNSAPMSGQEIAQKKRDFSFDAWLPLEDLSQSKKRCLQHKRALRSAKDDKIKTENQSSRASRGFQTLSFNFPLQ